MLNDKSSSSRVSLTNVPNRPQETDEDEDNNEFREGCKTSTSTSTALDIGKKNRSSDRYIYPPPTPHVYLDKSIIITTASASASDSDSEAIGINNPILGSIVGLTSAESDINSPPIIIGGYNPQNPNKFDDDGDEDVIVIIDQDATHEGAFPHEGAFTLQIAMNNSNPNNMYSAVSLIDSPTGSKTSINTNPSHPDHTNPSHPSHPYHPDHPVSPSDHDELQLKYLESSGGESSGGARTITGSDQHQQPNNHPDLDLEDAIQLPMLPKMYNTPVLRLFALPLYRNLLFCLVGLYFTVTGVQYWGTAYFESQFQADAEFVRFLFIVVSATAPTLGVVFGGAVIDRIGGMVCRL